MPSSVWMSTSVPFTSNSTARTPASSPGTVTTSPRSQQRLRPVHQPASIVAGDVVVAGDAQQVERHVVRQPGADGAERRVPVREVAAVLPQEVADERLRAPPVARRGQEGVLQLARDPPDIEHPVAALA